MKNTLSYDKNAKQFKADIGYPQKRFYLGGDVGSATQKKMSLNQFWANCGQTEWTPDNFEIAKAIAKGDKIRVMSQKNDSADIKEQTRVAELLAGTGATIQAPATSVDYIRLLELEIQELKKRMQASLGTGAVEGMNISLYEAMDAFSAYRMSTEIDPDTSEPTDHVKGEKNRLAMLKRLVGDMPLARLKYMEINQWAHKLNKRPIALNTGQPIAIDTVRNGLKTMRVFMIWASNNYGWLMPDLRCTRVIERMKRDEKIALLKSVERFYTPEQITNIWNEAKSFERLLLLLGLNFGFTQKQIISMVVADVQGQTTSAIRTKTDTLGTWAVWKLTREYGQYFGQLPKTKQAIVNSWRRLLDRVIEKHPDFPRLSFKWLRKTGSSMVRNLGPEMGEVSSVYLSHGESASTGDTLLERYASVNWKAVCDALRKIEKKLKLK